MRLKLTFAGKALALNGVGRVRTGGDEDSAHLHPDGGVYEVDGGGGKRAIEVQVPGGAAKVQAIAVR